MSGDDGDNISLDVIDYLAEYTLEDKWNEVVKMYYTFPEAHTVIINDFVGTALHVAIDLDEEEVVKELVNAIITVEEQQRLQGQQGTKNKALEMVNEHGDTPLHVAASRGFAKICKCIIGAHNERIYLMILRNNLGETPLFQAAINWRKQAFAYLSDISRNTVTLADLVRNDGDSILHCAIKREYFDLAVVIMHYYDFLSTHKNKEEYTPLKVLATRPTAFKSASSLSWWKKILYHCILVERVEAESTMQSNLRKMVRPPSDKMNFPENYTTLFNIISTSISFIFGIQLSGKKKDDLRSKKKKKQHDTENPPNKEQSICTNVIGACELSDKKFKDGSLPPIYATGQQFVRSAYMHTLGLSGVELKAVKKIKKNHKWSAQLLKALMQRPYSSFTGAGGRPTTTDSSVDEDMLRQLSRWKKVPTSYPGMSVATQESISTDTSGSGETSKSESSEEEKKLLTATVSDMGTTYRIDMTKKDTEPEKKYDPKETAFLVAARNGIVEMVNEILNRIPSAIHNTNSKKENVLLVAVANRQPLIVETLKKRMHGKKEVWNNLMLAVDDDENTMLHLAAQALGEDKPWQIAGSALQMTWDIIWFRYIKDLLPQHFYFRSNKDSKTAGEIFQESHKALVNEGAEWLKDTAESCSVVAGLVAGVSFATASSVPGGTNDIGRPTLEGYTAFDIFAISSLIGLCFSVTGLIMFLSILTSRKQAKDFRRDLPLKLLLGLSSLFVSIAAMFVSFCTGHVFVLNEKYKNFLLPIYAATCLPVSFYAIAQFPLYVDLLSAILTKVPQASDKGDGL